LAGIFFALGDASHAISLLVVARDSTCSPYWHIRFAQLCSRFGQQAAGVECLHGLKDVGRLDFYNRLQLCELTFIHNDRNVAWAMLERLIAEAFTDTAKAISLARTAGLLERYDCMHEAIGRVVMEEGLSGKVLELLLLYGTVPEIKDYSDVLLESHSAGISLQSQLYLILLQSGRTGREVVKSLLQHDNIAEYYALAGAGRLLLRAGLPDEAECCFQKSVALRPNAFLHLEFIGNIYFEQGMFKNAARYLQQVIATKSYLRHVWARYLYACLPKNYQQNKFSIVAQNVEILFQRKQDFYHQSGPTSK
jgi:tetratricopeptide (TPR) repeat protein